MGSSLTTSAIVIFTSADCADIWNGVLLGIEEEGILFVVQESSSTDVIHNVRLAACQSPLLIDISRSREKLVMYHKNLLTSAPLFTLTCQQSSHDHRSISNNAVRLAGDIPFRGCHS